MSQLFTLLIRIRFQKTHVHEFIYQWKINQQTKKSPQRTKNFFINNSQHPPRSHRHLLCTLCTLINHAPPLSASVILLLKCDSLTLTVLLITTVKRYTSYHISLLINNELILFCSPSTHPHPPLLTSASITSSILQYL